jgi:hypothetical protein
MSDLVVKSFRGQLAADDTQLTDSERELLIKLLSNTALFPDTFWSALANKIPLIMPDIPISQVNGFLKISKLEDYPTDNRYFLRGDGTWVQIAAASEATWGSATATWGDATYEWDGAS